MQQLTATSLHQKNGSCFQLLEHLSGWRFPVMGVCCLILGLLGCLFILKKISYVVKKGFNMISSYPINSPHMFFIYFVQSYILYLTCRVVVHCAHTGTYTILPPLYIHCCLQCKHLGLAMRNLVPQSSSTNASTIGNQKRVSKEQ